MEYRLHTDQLPEMAPKLRAGDRVILSGTIYTARDAAHKRFFELLDRGEALPFPPGPLRCKSGRGLSDRMNSRLNFYKK